MHKTSRMTSDDFDLELPGVSLVRLLKEIPAGVNFMSPNGNKARERVREQYEKFPYPPPTNNLDAFVQRGAYQGGCPHHHFHWYWPFKERTQDLDILIAGCGTQQAAQFAVHVPNARVTAIDISRRSLDSSRALLQRYGISNVSLHELPLEEIGTLGKEFDLIVSTGVLHHLPEPEVGIKALSSVLREEGSMYLMLYGRYGRDAVYNIQEMFRRMRLSVEDADLDLVRQIRGFVAGLPDSHPLNHRLSQYQQLQVSDAEIVDVFLHPQDRAYSMPDVYDLLGSAGLVMQKLVFRAHYAPRCSGLRDSPFLERIEALPEREQLSIGELYRSAAIMHFFIACPEERARSSYEVELTGANLSRLVPVRNPQISATESGNGNVVLSWNAHLFKDISYQLSSEHAPLFGIINGTRNVTQLIKIAETHLGIADASSVVIDFLKAMYDFDYIWFTGK